MKMETVTWTSKDGETVVIELPPDEEAFGSSWYAKDLIEFMTSIIWDAYPSMRPLIKRSIRYCYIAWEEAGMLRGPFYSRRYSKWAVVKHYFSALNWVNAGKFLSDLAQGTIFHVGEE